MAHHLNSDANTQIFPPQVLDLNIHVSMPKHPNLGGALLHPGFLMTR